MTRSRDVANIDGILTTTGDTYYASAAATPARLGVGSTGQVLTVAGGVPTWATPAGGLNYTTWTPTLGDWTLGNGSLSARYAQSGKFVHFELSVQLGSTSSVSGLNFTLPATPKASAYDVYNTMIGTARKTGQTVLLAIELRTNGNAVTKTIITNDTYAEPGNVTSTAPFTWASGNTIYISGQYEAA